METSLSCSFSECFAVQTHLKDGEQSPAIVHVILAFVVKKKPETKADAYK